MRRWKKRHGKHAAYDRDRNRNHAISQDGYGNIARHVRTGKHRNDAEDDFFDTLHGAPALRSLLVHQRIITWCVKDRYADIAIGVDWLFEHYMHERRTGAMVQEDP